MSTDLAKKVAVIATAAAAALYVDKQTYFSHDLITYGEHVSALLASKYLILRNTRVADLWEELVDRMPSKVLMTFEGRKSTAIQLEAQANRIAQWGLKLGLKPGAVVCLLMENRPEFITTWIGLSKIGVITALINTHIAEEGLLHCLKISNGSVIISGSECTSKLAAIANQLSDKFTGIYSYADTKGEPAAIPSFALSLDSQLVNIPPKRPNRKHRATISSTDMMLMIYTSGTTGLPKAARVEHQSMISRSMVFARVNKVTSFDRLYCPLPLYHTSGGVLAVGMMLLSGCSISLSRKFSTSKFWDEVRTTECTMMQYIGEMCRYLLQAPPSNLDRVNLIRVAIGNGLRPDIWGEFQDRFGIPAICEFYGATEGVGGMINMCRHKEDRGHLGQYGYLANALVGYTILQYDVDADELKRDSSGRFILCDDDEVGELVIPIRNLSPMQKFQGYYNDKNATDKKVLRNVFTEGDMYFRSGDLFRRDSQRRYYFVDRIGDTFRWQGENVATNEVGESISTFPGVSEVCVYGVAIPHHEGRACMVAMAFDEIDFDEFAHFCSKKLPGYAMPRFVRRLQTSHVTGTMKLEKAKLRNQGFNLDLVEGDQLYYLNRKDPSKPTYSPLTATNLHAVLTKSRL